MMQCMQRMQRVQGVLALVGLLLCGLVAGAPARAQPAPPDEPGAIRIQVKGSAQIQGAAHSTAAGFMIRGEVIDDAGAPVAGATVTIHASPLEGSGAKLALPDAFPCERRTRGPRVSRAAADEYSIDTDERGVFCVRGEAPLPPAKIHMRFSATRLHDAAEAQVPLDTQEARAARTLLRFEPSLEVIDLDREAVPITASLRVERTDAPLDASAKREGLEVVLEDERGTKVATALTGGDGRARFDVKTASLDAPGAGELRLRFDGAPGLTRSAAAMPVVRRAEVKLALSHPLDSADPEDGAPIDVDVTSARGPVSGGVVEAMRGAESVGTGAVEDGKARVIVSFPVDRAGSVELSLRYVAAAPWWRAGQELRVDLPIAGPGIVRQVLLALVVVIVTAWVIAPWRRAPKPRAPKDAEALTAPPSGRAGVQVVASPAGQRGWKGNVMDAHEGTAVAGARLAIVVPAFEGNGVVARASTDERGAFTLSLEGSATTAVPSGARLVVESSAHSTHEQALPPPSVLSVALVTRRRAVLDRLVRWARRQGSPFDGPPEPTPGHVRRVATRASAREVEAWAMKIEHLAFGPDEVDERTEKDVRSIEPKGGP
jgi:hypothetical protein